MVRLTADPEEKVLLLPNGTGTVLVFCRSSQGCRVSFEQGEVDDDGGISISTAWQSGPITDSNRRLYYASDLPGTILEVYTNALPDRGASQLGSGFTTGYGA